MITKAYRISEQRRYVSVNKVSYEVKDKTMYVLKLGDIIPSQQRSHTTFNVVLTECGCVEFTGAAITQQLR